MSLIHEWEKIDRQSALIFNREIKLEMKRNTVTFKRKNPVTIVNVKDLIDNFNWEKTRQGFDFWYDTFIKME